MAKSKVCKKCKVFVEGDKCPICKNAQFSTNWQGKVSVLDANKSQVAKFVGLKSKGEFVIKVK